MGQCLNRRIHDVEIMKLEATAWQTPRCPEFVIRVCL